jgi:hypothetical protein
MQQLVQQDMLPGEIVGGGGVGLWIRIAGQMGQLLKDEVQLKQLMMENMEVGTCPELMLEYGFARG